MGNGEERRVGGALGVILLLASGCAAPRGERSPEISRPAVAWAFDVREAAAPARLPKDADDLVLLNSAASVIAHDLKLALPRTVLAVAYADEGAFVDGLVRRGMAAEEARERARAGVVAAAVGASILVRADRFAYAPRATRLKSYAHELAHIAQRKIDRWRVLPVWIREGHADWVGHRVVEVLEDRGYHDSRDEVRRRLLASKTSLGQFPSLKELETTEAWRQAILRFGWAPTYGQAFLAVDLLVERYTQQRLHEFLFRRSDPLDLERDFWNASFPLPYDGFVAEFREYLQSLR